MTDDAHERPSTPGLMAEAMARMATLFQTEIRLVKAEVGEKITRAVTAVAVLAASTVLMMAALVFLLEGVVHLLIGFGMSPTVAYFVVGIVIASVAGVAVWFALGKLSASNLAPSRSMDQIGKDVQVLKGESI